MSKKKLKHLARVVGALEEEVTRLRTVLYETRTFLVHYRDKQRKHFQAHEENAAPAPPPHEAIRSAWREKLKEPGAELQYKSKGEGWFDSGWHLDSLRNDDLTDCHWRVHVPETPPSSGDRYMIAWSDGWDQGWDDCKARHDTMFRLPRPVLRTVSPWRITVNLVASVLVLHVFGLSPLGTGSEQLLWALGMAVLNAGLGWLASKKGCA